MWKWAVLAVGATGVSLIAGLVCFPSLPDPMAIHWNWHNQPDNSLPKVLAVVLLPLTSLLSLPVLAVLWAGSRQVDDPAAKRALHLAGGGVVAALAFMAVYVQGITVVWNLGHHFPLGWYVLPAVVGILGIVILSVVPLMKLEWSASRQAARTLPKGIWFAATRYGWGWGLPCAWQGWVVMGVWLAVFLAGVVAFGATAREARTVILFVAFVLGMSGALLGICTWRGEKPRWRWGDGD